MADHPLIANYKKNALAYQKELERVTTAAGAKIQAATKELVSLGVKPPLNLKALVKDKNAKIKAAAKVIQKAKQDIENAEASYRLNMSMLQIPDQVPEEEKKKLPEWLKKNVEAKGIVLHKTLILKPKMKVQNGKLKEASLTLVWKVDWDIELAKFFGKLAK